MRSLALVALLVLALFPPAQALPTPGLFCDPADAALGRLFPEAMQANDFVSYDEAVCGLERLDATAPDFVRIDLVTKSVGWDALTGGRDQFDVFVVRVTNEASGIPHEDKVRLVFQLSIHGNEKGGREGGLRVIEDLVRDMGMAREHPELRERLDWMELLFVFPNPDGWTHEEVAYRANDACYFSVTPQCKPGETGVESQSFVRVNGNGKDVNRQWPTVGWQREGHEAMGQPEAVGLVAYLMNETNVKYASDIHGMLNPADGTTPALGCVTTGEGQGGFDPTCFPNAVEGARGHYVLTMLPAGRQDTREMTLSTTLAELVKERLNSDPYFAEWHAAPHSVQGAWGGEFNDWGTVWDTLGYTDSGFTSDFYAQDLGLDAPGVDFELSYNHVTFDNYYPGLAQRMNDYHVRAVRDIVRAFMDMAAQDLQVAIDAQGTRTAFVERGLVVTPADRGGVAGWFAQNPLDDAFEAREWRASPDDYFADLRADLRNGALDALRPGEVTAARLAQYDNLVIAGSAAARLTPADVRAVKAWVEAGGNLVLTDDALQLLEPLGVVPPGSVESMTAYAGATNFVDKAHDLVRDVRGLARETYEPVPLGFTLEDGGNAPVWYVKADAFDGEVVGLAGNGQGSVPDPAKVDFGRAALGAGTVVFLGALLPDPLPSADAPYGVDAYATTYTGNQLLRNALGWALAVASADVDPASLGADDAVEPASAARVPGPAAALVVLAAAGLAVARRRRA